MLWFLCYPLLVVLSWIFYEYLRYKVHFSLGDFYSHIHIDWMCLIFHTGSQNNFKSQDEQEILNCSIKSMHELLNISRIDEYTIGQNMQIASILVNIILKG